MSENNVNINKYLSLITYILIAFFSFMLIIVIAMMVQYLPNTIFVDTTKDSSNAIKVSLEEGMKIVEVEGNINPQGITAKSIAIDVQSGSLYYEGKTVTINSRVESRLLNGIVTLDIGDIDDVSFWVYTDEQTSDINHKYSEGDIYRFNIFIKKIKWNANYNKYYIYSDIVR